jgi:hypothetical protein
MILHWIDEDKAPRSLPDLKRNLQKLAEETDVRHLPDYAQPSNETIIEAVREFDGLKDRLLPSDRVVMESPDESYTFNLSVRVDIAEIESLAVRETIEHPPSVYLLAVKKPDFLGESQWEFKLGSKLIKAKIEDMSWLQRFQSRDVDVRPGDALRCMVIRAFDYGFEGELLRERFVVTEVIEEVQNSLLHSIQTNFLEDNSNDDS